jgi:hypothetical protein
VEVLQRYLPVGGVRIEDDLLITSKGYENLTTAPKGDAMLRYIKQGKHSLGLVNNRRRISRTTTNENERPLLCAPGISEVPPQPIIRPIARAATMPAQLEHRDDIDFEPFEGPSLFTNFNTNMTTEEKIQRWQHERDSTLNSRKQPEITYQCTPVCGTDVKEVKHVYMTSGSIRPGTVDKAHREHYLPPCKQCTILCETLKRLRQNLLLSSPSSPKTKVELDVASTTPKQKLPCRRSNAHRTEQRVDQSIKRESKPDQVPWQDELAPRHQRAAETNRLTARRQRSTTGANLVDLRDLIKDTTSNPLCQVQQVLAEFEAGPSKPVSSLKSDGESCLTAYKKHLQRQEEESRRRLVSRGLETLSAQPFSLSSLPRTIPPATSSNTLVAFQKQLEILQEQTRHRLALRDSEMHMEKGKASPVQPLSIPEAESAFQLQMWEEHNKARLRFEDFSRRVKQNPEDEQENTG